MDLSKINIPTLEIQITINELAYVSDSIESSRVSLSGS